MRYLLDTHVLLWLLGSPDRVPAVVVSTVAAREHDLLVSAVSAMEVATKTRLGRLPQGRPLVDAWTPGSARSTPNSCRSTPRTPCSPDR